VVGIYDLPKGERHKGAFYNGSGALLLNQVIAVAVIVGWTGEFELTLGSRSQFYLFLGPVAALLGSW